MILFPNGKINLGLQITQKSPDGYHQIQTAFYPVQISDALEITATPLSDGLSFSSSGLTISTGNWDNLCVRAYHLLKEMFPGLGGLQMHLHKVIPMGAGLGGGSSDATSTLLLLNKIFELGLSTDVLAALALKLGSDCPFFIYNRPLLASGRGELFSEIPLSLKDYKLVLVFPGFHVSTAWAFSRVTPKKPETSLHKILALAPSEWKSRLVNDFEAPIAAVHPEVAEIREELYNKGAVYAALSGSGSTVFGLFSKGLQPVFQFKQTYLIHTSACLF